MTKSQYDHKIIGLGHITNNTVNNVSQYMRAPQAPAQYQHTGAGQGQTQRPISSDLFAAAATAARNTAGMLPPRMPVDAGGVEPSDHERRIHRPEQPRSYPNHRDGYYHTSTIDRR